ncbi:MAG: hypothetical protein PHQ43_04295 [Dehalococcoidales bacterium]|nr:hypothetical protein [Dehalococcoidales bacterium]
MLTDYKEQLKTGKVKAQYMTFTLTDRKLKTTVWAVQNTKSGYLLGTISYFPAWRQYVFDPCEGSTYNNSCLLDIVSVLDGLNELQKEKVA